MRLRRAQPWLGTLVEIEAHQRSRRVLQAAMDDAFGVIAQVHHLMSRQLPDSDVARLNRAPAGARVCVHRWTARTLTHALRWQQLSAGAFDIVEPDTGSPRTAVPVVCGERTSAGVSVLKQRNGQISLDGIAKGFAVDRAIQVLRRHQIESGLVIAGGDLRCFGARSFSVLLRRPDASDPAPGWQLQIRNAAMATSGRYFGGELWNTAGNEVRDSWTVVAPTATAADALTKVVYGLNHDSAALLRRCRARAWHVHADDQRFAAVEL